MTQLTKLMVAAPAFAMLSGCAGITDIIKKRESLYQAAPLNAPAVRPSSDAYQRALTAAQNRYTIGLIASPAGGVKELVDAGISAANANCRAWMLAVSAAEQRWRQGEANASVIQALVTGLLAASSVHRDVIMAWGLGTAAYAGYSNGFLQNVLGMSDYDLQTKVREAMEQRAQELRAQAMSYPQAVDAIEDYQTICTPQAAKALSRSALAAVKTTVAAAGTITVTPITSAFVKDDSGERITTYWFPGGVVNRDRETQVAAWMKKNGILVSIPFFANSKLYEGARKQAVVDLSIP